MGVHGRRNSHGMDAADRRADALLVVGGQQRTPRSLRDGRQDWHGYVKGLIIGVDVASGTTSRVLEYSTPPDARAGDEAAISFQAASCEGDRMYLCTETEVLVYRLPDFELLHYVSLPWFNDVHHVRPSPNGNLLVASAGLELVLEITLTGEVLQTWNVLGEDPWQRFDPTVDYRKVASTKPHRSHPNFIFCVDGDVWVTRFHQGDAICLTAPRKPVEISDQRIHDGVLAGGRLYFTTVDGTIIVVDTQSMTIETTYDLNGFHEDRNDVLGWCRGVLVEGDQVWVGFSRIRPTRFRENVGWVARGFRHDMPTHIACYDLARGACLSEIPLEEAGLSAVYSIFPADSRSEREDDNRSGAAVSAA